MAVSLQQQQALARAAARRRKAAAEAQGPGQDQSAYSDALSAASQASQSFSGYKPQTPDTPRTVSGPSQNVQSTGGMQNFMAGFDRGVNTALGAPVDFPVWVGNSLINAANSGIEMAGGGRPVPNIPTDLPGSREGWERTQGKLGFTTPDQVAAGSDAEKLLRAGGEAVGTAILPELFAVKGGQVVQQVGNAAAPVLRQTVDAAQHLLGSGPNAGRFASNMAVNAAAGMGAQAASDAAPDGWEMPAALAGGIAAATPVALATAVPGMLRSTGQVVGDFLAPLTKQGQERLAGQTLAENAADLPAFRQSLDNLPSDIVPGSRPTTFQATGDMGIGGLERGVATRNPVEFGQRRADQNNARIDAMAGIQSGGAPEQVAASVRSFVNAIDQETQSAIDALRTKWDQSLADINASGNRAVANAQQRAQQAASGLGQGRVPEVVGGDMRQALEAARAQAKAQEGALWQAVDPNGTLALPVTSIRQRVAAMQSELTSLSARPEGVEAAIYADIARSGDGAQPLRAVRDLDTRVKTAMREERKARGESPAWARLSQLKSAIEADLDAAVAGKVAQERQAVQAGSMAYEDSIEAVIQRQREAWFGQAAARAESGRGGASSGGNGSGRYSPIPGVRSATSEDGRGFATGARDQGLPGAPSGANFDQAALERLRAARGATLDRVNTFDNKLLAPMRQRPSSVSDYTMPAGTVPQKVFFPGTASAEAITRFRKAVGDEQAMSLLSDFIVDRLRKSAMRADGMLDPVKVANFQRAHADALRSFPELNKRFGGAANLSSNVPVVDAARSQAVKDATKAAEDAIAAQSALRKQELDQAQKGALGRLMGLEDPTDISRTVGSIFQRQDAVNEMARLRKAIGSNEQAKEGLRKAVVDYISERFVSNTAAGTSEQNLLRSDQFQSFVKRNRSALQMAGMTADELKVLDDIAADLRRSNQSITAVRIPGGSNTAQDTFAAKPDDTMFTALAKMGASGAVSGGLSSVVLGPWLGVPIGVATTLVGAMRQAGLQTVDDLVKDAMLNPARARLLLQKVKPRQREQIGQILAQQYRRSGLVSASGGEF